MNQMSEPLSERATRDRALFDSIALGYFKKDTLPAHRMARQLRIKQTMHLTRKSSPLDILEVGCGAGFSAEYLAGTYSKYVGVDYSERLVEFAQAQHQKSNIDFVVGDINAINFKEKFDVIVMIGLLHHLDDPSATLSRLKYWLKPGGCIAANEPQSGNPLVSWMRVARKKVDSNYSDEQLEFSEEELRTIFLDAGLTDVRIQPQGLLSTPFAEVAMPVQGLVSPVSKMACKFDAAVETRFSKYLNRLAWNLIGTGQYGGH